ncbi:unnamed protein product [Blepharisma stoltei]|uniref:Uncharacterized protein n=1 Tax=Blepharisma stoltei TaxID=1481888 RepID=A0AAU9JG70_9CILI|nr:unnamed protein product [Blepharisma stoltei]
MKINKSSIPRPHAAVNEIYITRKRPIQAYIKRAEKLMEQEIKELIIHGSGMAIPRALDVANNLRRFYNSFEIQTSSVAVVDELDHSENCEDDSRLRLIPAVHIRLSDLK